MSMVPAMFASLPSPRGAQGISFRSASRRGSSSSRARRSRPPARAGPPPATAPTNGTSPRRPSGSTPTPMTWGRAAFPSILIVGDEGDILIDGGPEQAADLIAANIRALGYRVEDIRFILHSHEHLDHVGGIAKLQRLSGATVISSPARENGDAKPARPARTIRSRARSSRFRRQASDAPSLMARKSAWATSCWRRWPRLATPRVRSAGDG